jgi:hypothetical protein
MQTLDETEHKQRMKLMKILFCIRQHYKVNKCLRNKTNIK